MNLKQVREQLVYIPTTMLPALIGILAYPLLTRWFTTEQYGEYALILTTTTLLCHFGGGWIINSTLRFYQPEQKNGPRLFRLALISGLVILLTALLTGFLLRSQAAAIQGFILPGVLFIGLFIPFRTLNMMDRVETHQFRYSLWDSGLNAGKFLLGLLLIWLSGNTLGLVTLFWVADGIMFAGIVFLLNRRQLLTRIEKQNESLPLKRLIRYGFPLSLTLVATWLYQMSDTYILQYYWSTHLVGVFATANSLVEKSMKLLPTAIMLAAWPDLIREYERAGWVQALRLQNRQVRFYLLIMVPVAIAFVFVAPHVFRWVIDSRYHEGALILTPIGLSALVYGLANYYLGIFNLDEKSHWVVSIVLSGGVLKVLLSLWFVPRYGLTGAAWSTFSAVTGVMLTAMLLVYVRYRKRYTMQSGN